MKKTNFFSMSAKAVAIAAIAVGFTACSSDEPATGANQEKAENAISFALRSSNMSRNANLETEHPDFGVWTYKPGTPSPVEVMKNYKVQYDATNGWEYAGINGQTLKYFDKNAATTSFYAYTPYAAGANFTEGTKTLEMPSWTGTYNDNATNIATAPMYGTTTVASDDYDKDVKITFTRAHALVGVAFTESVPGYKVEIIDLGGNNDAGTGTNTGIQALPVYSDINTSVTPNVYKSTNASSVAAEYTNVGTPTVVFGTPNTLSYSAQTKTAANLVFAAPGEVDNSTDNTPVASATKYYAVPSQYDGTKTGTTAIEAVAKNNSSLYFHISFKLISDTNANDEIYFYNVKVLVPAEYTQWAANKSYTYKFDVTPNFKGGKPTAVDGADKDYTIDTAAALQPIVFAGVDIEDITTENTITTSTNVH